MTHQVKVTRQYKSRGKRRHTLKATNSAIPDRRVPRISRLMALAIRFDQLIRDGVVADQAELACLGHVCRARLTQLMNLTNLAPDIQEQLLDGTAEGLERNVITERTAAHSGRTQLANSETALAAKYKIGASLTLNPTAPTIRWSPAVARFNEAYQSTRLQCPKVISRHQFDDFGNPHLQLSTVSPWVLSEYRNGLANSTPRVVNLTT